MELEGAALERVLGRHQPVQGAEDEPQTLRLLGVRPARAPEWRDVQLARRRDRRALALHAAKQENRRQWHSTSVLGAGPRELDRRSCDSTAWLIGGGVLPSPLVSGGSLAPNLSP